MPAPPPPLFVPPALPPAVPVLQMPVPAPPPAPPPPPPQHHLRAAARARTRCPCPSRRSAPPPPPRAATGPALVFEGGGVPQGAAAGGAQAAAEGDGAAAAAPAGVAPGGRARAGVLRQPRDHGPAGHPDPGRARDGAQFDPARPRPRDRLARRARLRRQPVLIPRGSRLIGEYRSEVAPGQRRALVNWTRLIRPDGVTIAIGSPAGDPLGRGGISARVNSHFFERFAGAILQSALDIGVNLASQRGQRHRRRAARQIQGAVGQIVQPQQITPTLTVQPGHQHHRSSSRATSISPASRTGDEPRPGRRGRGEGVYLRSYLAPLGRYAGAARRHRHLRQPARRNLDRDDRRRDRAARRARARRGDARSARPADRGALAPGDQPRASLALRHAARRRPRPDGRPAGDARAAGAGDPQACLARSDARRLCRRRRLRRDKARQRATACRSTGSCGEARRRRHRRHARRWR